MQELPVILFGLGGVGRALVRQILATRRLHAEQYDLVINVLVICDSTSIAMELGQGIDDANLHDLLELKEAGGKVSEHALGGLHDGDLVGIVQAAGRVGVAVVDCTASTTTVPALLYAQDHHYKIVLANKKPLTVEQEVYHRLTRAGVTQGDGEMPRPRFGLSRWETTVGAAIPVIVTQNRMMASGDDIHRIAGTFSGTLGYVMTGLQAGRRFSEVVREAYQQGYTEPDPRDDLGGVDVARKALILARGLGWEMEMSDIPVTSLYPRHMDALSVDEFLDALPELDQEFAERGAAAAAEGKVLRYAATIEDHRCAVGPTLVAVDSPLGRLTGTDNLVEFHSRWHNPNPLVIQGRGAGIHATASGVLSDIVELGFTTA